LEKYLFKKDHHDFVIPSTFQGFISNVLASRNPNSMNKYEYLPNFESYQEYFEIENYDFKGMVMKSKVLRYN